MSWPSATTTPVLGLTMPQTIEISVVLPAPFGPSSAKISPRRIDRLMCLRALKPDAYVLERSVTRRIACIPGGYGAEQDRAGGRFRGAPSQPVVAGVQLRLCSAPSAS